ncbi:MAG: hypothetical protein Q7T93_02160 [Methylobacterium sp.]|uniref:hypothetical protein n=1 Tax=Methylobacterium sp. TaxID=409 RepID=UPI002718962E|nr:hypothetical protein [Methylobacterium sp.]MDO9425612.1 hypothetical protein [Methylobacterium sp.]
MSELPLQRVEEIGLRAARAIAGETVRALKVRRALDSTDEVAYYLFFLSDRSLPEQALTSLSIAQKVRDTLIRDGDLSYPYVRLLPKDEWERQ